MKKTVKLSLNLNMLRNGTFKGIFDSPSDGEIVMKSWTELYPPNLDRIKDKQVRPFSLQFSSEGVTSYTHVYNYTGKDSVLDKNYDKIIFLLSKHQQVLSTSNPECKFPFYLFEILEETEKSKVNNFQKRVEAGNALLSMEEAEIDNIIYFFDGEPAKMNYDSKISFINERILMNDVYLYKFLEIFNKTALTIDTVQRIVFKKALMEKIIARTPKGFFYPENKLIGTDFETALLNFTDEKDAFDMVRRKLGISMPYERSQKENAIAIMELPEPTLPPEKEKLFIEIKLMTSFLQAKAFVKKHDIVLPLDTPTNVTAYKTAIIEWLKAT